MDGDEVGNLAQLSDGHGGGLLLLEHVSGQVGIVSHDLHAEDAGDLAHALADAAEAQNAQGLALELAAHELILVPVLVDGDVVVGGDGVAADLQHLADGQLSNGVAVQAGSVKDLDALFLGVLGVDVVQAHGANADDLQVLGGVQNVLVDHGIHAHNQNVNITDLSLQLILAGGQGGGGDNFHVLAQDLCDLAGNGVNDKALHDNQILPYNKNL